jgi:hypothetical protein
MKIDPISLWMQIERLERMIRAAELKAGLIISFHSLILGLLFDKLELIKPIFDENILYFILASIWILLVIFSLYFSIKCFIPRLELKYDDNVFFFGDIVSRFGDAKEYSAKLKEVCKDENEFISQLAEQIHAESNIIGIKFKYVQKSIKFLAYSFIFVVLIIGLWLIKI